MTAWVSIYTYTIHTQGNAFLQRHQPWQLIKQPAEEQRWLDTVLHTGLECLRLCCTLLYPVIPHSMIEARQRMGLSTNITVDDLQCRLSQEHVTSGSNYISGASHKLNSSNKPLFLKIWYIFYSKHIIVHKSFFIQVYTIFGL